MATLVRRSAGLLRSSLARPVLFAPATCRIARVACQARGLATQPSAGADQDSSKGSGDSKDAGGERRPTPDSVVFTWKSAIFTCFVGGACVWYYDYLKEKKQAESRAITTQERIGSPRLGGPFELLDRKGNSVTEKDFLGQYLLIYFGFTFCPDICPQEMEKQSRAIELLDEEFGPIATPMFISVDPKRDKPSLVDDYCKDFHPRIVGLTGTPEQVKKVSRAYRVYYNEGLKTDDEDYLVDHSIIHYFVGKNGKFIDFFGKNMTAKEMAEKMRSHIRKDSDCRLQC
ncbi:unnamed protein product [Durusdinium trenchii]|uniref:Uncharacterized protein n=1 Tax=Durusdinium trenchii TaxID=1381693 RepID=A0ABP0KGT4_9DINO